jgi:hypothetical protein
LIGLIKNNSKKITLKKLLHFLYNLFHGKRPNEHNKRVLGKKHFLDNEHTSDKDNVRAIAFCSYQSYSHHVKQNNDTGDLFPFKDLFSLKVFAFKK